VVVLKAWAVLQQPQGLGSTATPQGLGSTATTSRPGQYCNNLKAWAVLQQPQGLGSTATTSRPGQYCNNLYTGRTYAEINYDDKQPPNAKQAGKTQVRGSCDAQHWHCTY
jgi:hypothetical protein